MYSPPKSQLLLLQKSDTFCSIENVRTLDLTTIARGIPVTNSRYSSRWSRNSCSNGTVMTLMLRKTFFANSNSSHLMIRVKTKCNFCTLCGVLIKKRNFRLNTSTLYLANFLTPPERRENNKRHLAANFPKIAVQGSFW